MTENSENKNHLAIQKKTVCIPVFREDVVDQQNNGENRVEACINRDKTGVWQKGYSGNPHGRPKGSFDFMAELRRTLKKIEKEKGKTFIEHFIEMAYKDKQVAIALAKKLLPDLTEGDCKDSGIQILINRPGQAETLVCINPDDQVQTNL